jgi:hypothetical protein
MCEIDILCALSVCRVGAGTISICAEAQLSFGSDHICAAYVSGQGYPARAVESIETTIAAAIPADACSPLQNARELAGKIVVVDNRGECSLPGRILRAQALAALAVIVVNGTDASAAELANVTIPVVRVTRTDQSMLESHLGQRGALSIGKAPCQSALQSIDLIRCPAFIRLRV